MSKINLFKNTQNFFSGELRLSQKNKVEKKFIKLAGVIIGVVFISICLAFIFPNAIAKKGITIGDKFSQGNNSFTLASALIANNKNIEMNFYVNTNQIDPLDPLKIYVSTTKQAKNKLPAKLIQVSEDFYTVIVTNVPQKNQKLYIKLGTNSELGDSFQSLTPQLVSTVKFNKKNFGQPSKADLQLTYLKYMVVFYEQKVQKLDKKINTSNGKIKTLNTTIEKQKDSLELQTGSQRKATNSKLASTQTSLEEEEKSLNDFKDSRVTARSTKKKYQNKLKNYDN